MPIEEENFFANAARNQPFRDDITRNTVGPRGIDMIEAERVNSAIPSDPLLNNPSRVFPVYDGHGNMVASLKRGSGSYTLANEKRYDAWGQVRYDDGVGTSDHVINPRNRYCANLGHWDDDVLGLTYMRARWYEPTTGRFVSEDPSRKSLNWMSYCSNNPTGNVDPSGNEELGDYEGPKWLLNLIGFASSLALVALAIGVGMVVYGVEPGAITAGYVAIGAALTIIGLGMDITNTLGFGSNAGHALGLVAFDAAIFAARTYHIGQMICGLKLGQYTVAAPVVIASFLYSLSLVVIIASIDAEL
jgi:RHS repeat-associated protein